MNALLSSAALPVTGTMQLAYLTPEEVLLQDQSLYYGSDGAPLPINPRRAQMIVDQQAKERLAAENSSQSSVRSSSSSSVTYVPVGSFPPELSLPSGGGSTYQAPVQEVQGIGGLDPQTLRLLDRLQQREQQSALVASTTSTRPLSSSGPETIATVVAMMFAIAVTIVWAMRRKVWQ